ncbi:putative peptidyl-tRNA hydrolase, PTH2, peptidyl-tRNA hydrolase II domain superfamily [Septoria linicola]|nr:putative peptidyl-tRNA hydrolase, PTH2, peptidyl-tRNA hydrolase II domain superfamily [Septoria linicola]
MAQPPLDRLPPSAASYAIAAAIVSFTSGYFLGKASSIGLFGRSPATTSAGADSDDASESDSDESTYDLGELQTFKGNTEECKLVLVVRTDLGMTKGKMAAQCGHATLACYKAFLRSDPNHELLKRWESLGQAKVALKVDSEDEMLMMQATAVSLGLCAQVIHDAGRTQIASGSATVLGIGPAPKGKIDEVTGHLKLL